MKLRKEIMALDYEKARDKIFHGPKRIYTSNICKNTNSVILEKIGNSSARNIHTKKLG